MVFADEIPFAFSGNSIGQEEIDEIDDFPGKKDFIRFYTIHNGGDFIDGAWFYPQTGDAFDKSFITLAMFLKIPVGDQEKEPKGLNIDSVSDIVVEKYNRFDDFVLFHIPFALDVTDNPFWIDTQTGEIKYIDFQMSTNPKDVITVASSFREFCQHIKRRGR